VITHVRQVCLGAFLCGLIVSSGCAAKRGGATAPGDSRVGRHLLMRSEADGIRFENRSKDQVYFVLLVKPDPKAASASAGDAPDGITVSAQTTFVSGTVKIPAPPRQEQPQGPATAWDRLIARCGCIVLPQPPPPPPLRFLENYRVERMIAILPRAAQIAGPGNEE